jgi:nitrite reductase (NADH) large subunit
MTAIDIHIKTGVSAERFESVGTSSDKLVQAIFAGGSTADVQTLVLSMGVKPETSLARGCKLSVSRGIIVDKTMQTSDPDIFAVGDCAEFEGIVWGIIPAALEQAPVAARFAHQRLYPEVQVSLDERAAYIQTVPKTILSVAGLEIISVGTVVPDQSEMESGNYIEYRHTAETGKNYQRYEKLIVCDGKLVGAILFGSREHQKDIYNHMNKPVSETEIRQLQTF